jgi:hypothetical protein
MLAVFQPYGTQVPCYHFQTVSVMYEQPAAPLFGLNFLSHLYWRVQLLEGSVEVLMHKVENNLDKQECKINKTVG